MDLIELIDEAIEREKESVELYRRGAGMAEDPETRTFFEQLAKWEQDHGRILRDRRAALKLIKGQP
jgi:rubrerythrin